MMGSPVEALEEALLPVVLEGASSPQATKGRDMARARVRAKSFFFIQYTSYFVMWMRLWRLYEHTGKNVCAIFLMKQISCQKNKNGNIKRRLRFKN